MEKLLKEKLESTFNGIQVGGPGKDNMVVTAGKDAVHAVLGFLKNMSYDHLALISCVDWMQEKELELVYVLSAYMQKDDGYTEKERMNIILKTRIPREKPEFPTVIPIFENAEPYEREIHELYGVDFKGHPRLTPLFLEREYNIPPFRKDFDTRKYVEEVFDKIPFVDKAEKK